MQTITGTQAMNRIRNLKLVPGATFGMIFYTCDTTRKEYGQVRRYDRCRLRPAMKDEGLKVSADHYLFFENVDTGDARQCFKKLIRKVCFPPSQDWLTIKWFE